MGVLRSAAAGLAGLLLAATIHPAAAADSSEHTIMVGGVERTYLVSRPASPVAGSQPQAKRPTVIVLHGGLLSAKGARRDMGFEPLVDVQGLIAVYPNAISSRWNDGRKAVPSPWRGDPPDDVAFVRAIVSSLVGDGSADPARIYVTGPSNGGMMTYRLICEAADLFAAAAPIIANIPVDLVTSCHPAPPVAVLVMNGTADSVVPYEGGPVGFRGGRSDRDGVLSTDDTVTWLRRFDGCNDKAEQEQLPDLDPGDGSKVVVRRWTHCTSGAPVVLYRIEGGGHRVPSLDRRRTRLVDRVLGRENHDIDAAEVIWAFFEDKVRKTP
jgi:polyhydroxybutyrate depolymerase